jgi:hypothetical protein
MALGIEELVELVVDLGPQEIPQHRLHPGLVARFPGREARIAEHLRHRQQRRIQVLDEADAERGVPEHADHDQDGEQDAAIPEREAGADRKRSEVGRHHWPSLSM